MIPHRLPPPPPVAANHGRVLIVDDDEAMCETLAACLVRRSFAIAWRTSAREACALLDQEEFDVILTDLHMVDMDGLALCEHVIALRPGLPVIIASGFGTPEIRAAALTAGAYDFIIKPFDLESLRLVLGRAVAFGHEGR